MNRGAGIVEKAGQRELRCARTPANRLVPFNQQHRTTRLRQAYPGGETIRPRSHHHRVVRVRHFGNDSSRGQLSNHGFGSYELRVIACDSMIRSRCSAQ